MPRGPSLSHSPCWRAASRRQNLTKCSTCQLSHTRPSPCIRKSHVSNWDSKRERPVHRSGRQCGLAAAVMMGAFMAHLSGAQAATVSCSTAGLPGVNGNSSAVFSLSQATQAQCFGGNNNNTVGPTFSMFNLTGWIASDATDAPGNGPVQFLTTPSKNGKTGTWSVDTFAGLTNVVLTLKAGNGFAAFLLNTASLSGLWSSSKGLSHATLYYNGDPSPVPLPPSLGLLILGLLGLGYIGRRRRLSDTRTQTRDAGF